MTFFDLIDRDLAGHYDPKTTPPAAPKLNAEDTVWNTKKSVDWNLENTLKENAALREKHQADLQEHQNDVAEGKRRFLNDLAATIVELGFTPEETAAIIHHVYEQAGLQMEPTGPGEIALAAQRACDLCLAVRNATKAQEKIPA